MIREILSHIRDRPKVVPDTEPLDNHVSCVLAKGACYLAKEPAGEYCLEIFSSLVKGKCQDCSHQEAFPCESIGCNKCSLACACKECRNTRAQGLCITLRPPLEIRLTFALQTTQIFWLSNHGAGSISPSNLEIISDMITAFLRQSQNPVVLLDGVEYLIVENGSAPVLKFLKDAAEQMIMKNAILILPVNPKALEEKELALMERTMKNLKAPGFPGK